MKTTKQKIINTSTFWISYLRQALEKTVIPQKRWRIQSRQVLPFAELQPFIYWSKRSLTATTVIHNGFSATRVDLVYSPNSQTRVIHQVKCCQSACRSFELDRTDIPNSLSTFGHSWSPGGALLWARNCRLLEVIYLFFFFFFPPASTALPYCAFPSRPLNGACHSTLPARHCCVHGWEQFLRLELPY